MEEEVRVRTPKSGEIPGVVETMLGSNKLRVRCQDGKVRMGRIPGKLRKRVWIRIGDVVLLRPWDIQGEKNGDITWRYTLTEANALKRKGFLAL